MFHSLVSHVQYYFPGISSKSKKRLQDPSRIHSAHKKQGIVFSQSHTDAEKM